MELFLAWVGGAVLGLVGLYALAVVIGCLWVLFIFWIIKNF